MNNREDHIDKAVEEMFDKVQSKKNELLEELFKKNGFTMEYVRQHNDEFVCEETGNLIIIETYFHKQKKLFSIIIQPFQNGTTVSVGITVIEHKEEKNG